MLAYGSTPVEILQHSFADGDTAKFFSVETEPMPEDEITKGEATSGVKVRLTVAPGLPVGAVRQTLQLTTNLHGSATIDVPIRGRVDGDLSIIGAGWDADRGLLSLGTVKSETGARQKVFILIHGPLRREVKLSVGERTPGWLQAELAEPQEVSQGAVIKVPLTVIIPPGTRPVNHSGSIQGPFAELVIDTTHPKARQLKLNLQFFVEE